ncbi:hypothetical protein [Absidia glauca]|uniref:MSP domain-containing protein n=1 Tax=Absidia glauca TaxID=4829 RepID=A0A168R0J8_ABSGL|nr:hypothetical protein [Absidia glauca]
MPKSYASSVYSQKSTASARSGRSVLSFTAGATIWPSFTNSKKHNVDDDATPPDSLNQVKQGVWKNLKSWIPSTTSTTRKDEGDDDTNTIKSSSSSLGKWKKLLVSPTQYMGRQRDQPTTLTTSPIDTASLSDKASSITTQHQQQQEQQHYPQHQPGGILVNIGAGSAQDIAEQEKRRKQRRLYLMRVQLRQQQQQQSTTAAIPHRLTNSSSSFGSIDAPQDDIHHKRQVGFNDNMYEYSSSSTLLSTPPDDSITMLDKLDNNDTDVAWYSAAPRVMFVEPSPVPRFRNEPPAPPPSPPYLNVIVQPLHASNPNNTNNTSPIDRHSLIAENDHSDIPTIFTTIPQQIQQQHSPLELPEQRPRLVFTSPLERGQTITFSLQNAIPDDHIIIYKFLTSNSRLQRKDTMGLVSSSSWAPSSSLHPSMTERYFVRPSAGLMTAANADVMLFLNQTPSPLAPGEVLKDKILVRWAVIQRGTQVEAWTKKLKESNRRKWLEMLLEEWPDQVVEKRTRISIRFV